MTELGLADTNEFLSQCGGDAYSYVGKALASGDHFKFNNHWEVLRTKHNIPVVCVLDEQDLRNVYSLLANKHITALVVHEPSNTMHKTGPSPGLLRRKLYNSLPRYNGGFVSKYLSNKWTSSKAEAINSKTVNNYANAKKHTYTSTNNQKGTAMNSESNEKSEMNAKGDVTTALSHALKMASVNELMELLLEGVIHSMSEAESMELNGIAFFLEQNDHAREVLKLIVALGAMKTAELAPESIPKSDKVYDVAKLQMESSLNTEAVELFRLAHNYLVPMIKDALAKAPKETLTQLGLTEESVSDLDKAKVSSVVEEKSKVSL